MPVADSHDDPTVLADDTVEAWPDGGTFVPEKRSESDIGWSVGANYKVNPNLAFYSHYTDTFMFRSDLLGEAINASRGKDVTEAQKESKTELNFIEIGVRYRTDYLSVTTTAYNTQFTPQAINVTIEENGQEVLKSIEFDTEAWGIEVEATWYPTVSKKNRPPKPQRNPACPTVTEIALNLLKQFRIDFPLIKIDCILRRPLWNPGFS